jgi:hypothetical protein
MVQPAHVGAEGKGGGHVERSCSIVKGTFQKNRTQLSLHACALLKQVSSQHWQARQTASLSARL